MGGKQWRARPGASVKAAPVARIGPGGAEGQGGCRVRPALAAFGTSFLFPGAHGGKALVTLRGQISHFLARELGVRLTPHQFRHLIGFIYLRQHPHGIEVVRALLGHRSIATTLRHYAGLEGAEAARHYDAALRQVAGPPAPAAKPGRPGKCLRQSRRTLPVAAE
jgi:integrase